MPKKIKDGAYVINLDEYPDLVTYWIAFHTLNNKVTYFGSFEVEHILKGIKKTIKRSKIVTNIFKIQVYDSAMCGYFCIGFIDFMLEIKSLTGCTNLFSRHDVKKNYNIISNYLMANL